MPLPITKYQHIKDFQTFLAQIQNIQSYQMSDKFKDPNNIETRDCQKINQRQSRSLKPKLKNLQLSFQQNFMKQHIQAFNFYVEKYIQQMFVGHRLSVKNFSNQTIFPKKSIHINNPNQIQSYLKSSCCPLGVKKAQMFIEDLQHQQKLYEFLDYVCSNSCDQVAMEVLIVANEIWEQYLKIQEQGMSYQKIIEYSKNLVEYNCQNIINQKLIKYLTFEKTYIKPNIKQQHKINELKKFIEFFIVTIFLVISEYFTNPYYEYKIDCDIKSNNFFYNCTILDEYENYSQSEEFQEQQYFLKGRKKIKSESDSDG